ncbi:MAG: hypothetical protein JSU72_08855 [Deltaproteobacteria bacterium]|nr:MAG: hypothetical protein JSU72_08855 [Deltaproteobacteria bacterium]
MANVKKDRKDAIVNLGDELRNALKKAITDDKSEKKDLAVFIKKVDQKDSEETES